MNGKRAKELRKVARLLGIDYRLLKHNYSLLRADDASIKDRLRKLQRGKPYEIQD